MLAEHAFVSRLEADDVRRQCTGLLEALGFACDVPSDALLHGQRGGVAVGRARSPAEWPLHVRVQYDRGKGAVAASIEEGRTKKPGPAGERLLLELLRLLEAASGGAPAAGEGARSWNELLAATQAEQAAGRSRRSGAIVGCVIVAVVFLLLVAILAVAGKG
jgi:hypothetical protein